MIGSDLYTLLCNVLLGGIQVNVVAFYQLLNLIKNSLESERPWQRLRAISTDQVWVPTDTYLTGSKALPSDFRSMWPKREGQSSIRLLDSAGNLGPVINEIQEDQKYDYKDSIGFFYVDHANAVYYFTGTADKSYSIRLPYKKKSADITASTKWIFPDEYHSGLVEIMAAMHKMGIDFDDINSRMAPQNTADYQRVRTSMIQWDTELQLNSLLP